MSPLFAKEPQGQLAEHDAIRRAQDGDAAAFEDLYKSYGPRVYGLCLRMVKNKPEAEDLTQQVFLQLFRKIGSFRGNSCFSTWLHRVTVNTVLMHLRRKKPIERFTDSAEPTAMHGSDLGEAESSDISMLGAVDRLHLMRAIRKLPPGYKRLFLLHDVMGYLHTEIANLVGCSVGCSKSQVHKARLRLRSLLRGEQFHAERDVVSA